jgi:catechol 2,3-dioxygenase-like lactoylglutathione lyase family enzyme
MAEMIRYLTPMAKVVDVKRSIDFYAKLGFKVRNTVKDDKLRWADLTSANADPMLSLEEEPAAGRSAGVVFYLYASDLVALRAHLLAQGIAASEISYPPYMPKGEICVTDPDGFLLLIGQMG